MKNLSNKKTKKKGFTLIELIIVLAVMAIIAAIAIPSFSAVKNSSKKKADQQSCETIRRTVLTLVADGTVPTPTADEGATYVVTFPDTGMAVSNDTGNIIKTALAEVKAPQLSDAVKYTIKVDKTGSVTVNTETADVIAK